MASFIPRLGVGAQLKKLIKVSIVDDDEYDRLLLKRILEKSAGFACASMHASGAEALDLIPKVNPLLAFLDVRMPGMNGVECTRRLKLLMPRLKIIIVTGLLDVATMNESLRAGGDNYLIKPVVAAQCLAMLIYTVREGIPATDKSRELRKGKGVRKVSVPAIVEFWLDGPPIPLRGWATWRANCGCNIRYPGAIYHMMNRGDRREPIFRKERKGVSPGYCRILA